MSYTPKPKVEAVPDSSPAGPSIAPPVEFESKSIIGGESESKEPKEIEGEHATSEGPVSNTTAESDVNPKKHAIETQGEITTTNDTVGEKQPAKSIETRTQITENASPATVTMHETQPQQALTQKIPASVTPTKISDASPSKSASASSSKAIVGAQNKVTSPTTTKTPPVQKTTPKQIKTPSQRKSIGPLSPAASTSTRRSSSPFMNSPTKSVVKMTPKRDAVAASGSSRTAPITPVSAPQSRIGSLPKSASATKANPRSSLTPKITKASQGSPLPKQHATPTASKEVSTPLFRETKTRPRSALGESSPSARRVVSHPPRPSTSASNKPPQSLNRSTSLRSLPRGKRSSDHAAVPPVPAVVPQPKATIIPSLDYSHLPAFMRPTQASQNKVVSRRVSGVRSDEAVKNKGHSFKV